MSWYDDMVLFFQHPFWMLTWGIVTWFTLLWSIARNKKKALHFWRDQKDEIIVTVMFGFGFLMFTSLMMTAYDWAFDNETPTEFHCFYYFFVGPIVERIYKLKSK